MFGALGAIGGALVSTIGNLIGGSQRRKQSRWNVLRTIQAKKEMAEMAFQRNKKMWKMMKKYNTPRAQMQRYKAAGLNPNLIYGQGTPGNVSSFPTYNAPDISYRGIKGKGYIGEAIAGGITQFQNIRQKSAQIDLVQEQADVAIETAKVKAQQEIILGMESDIKEIQALQAAIIETRMDPSKGEGIMVTPYGNVSIEYQQKLMQKHFAKMKRSQLMNVYQGLKNRYNRIKNRFAKEGMSISDNIQWRALISIIESVGNQLGFDSDWIDFSPTK